MKCGDRGHVTNAGQPCGQTISTKAAGCVWHVRSAEGRREIATRGGYASALKHALATLPADTMQPALESPAGLRTLLADTIQQTRTGRLDAKIASVVIAGVVAAIKLAELQLAGQIGELERRFRLRHP